MHVYLYRKSQINAILSYSKVIIAKKRREKKKENAIWNENRKETRTISHLTTRHTTPQTDIHIKRQQNSGEGLVSLEITFQLSRQSPFYCCVRKSKYKMVAVVYSVQTALAVVKTVEVIVLEHAKFYPSRRQISLYFITPLPPLSSD